MKIEKQKRRSRAIGVQRLVRMGRKIIVNGIEWRWRVGKWGGVTMRSETGERLFADASTIKGQSDPEIFARGQYKRTSDGMVTPREIAQFINANG